MTVRSPQPWARNGNASKSVHTDMPCQFGRPPNPSPSRVADNYFWTVSRLPSPGGFKTYSSVLKQPSSTALFQTGIPVVPSRFKLEYLATGTTSAALFTQTPQRCIDPMIKSEGLRNWIIAFSAIGFNNLFMKKQPKNCRNLVKVKLILF